MAEPLRHIPVRLNGALCAAFTALQALCLLALPTWLLPQSGVWAWLLVPACLLNNPQWALMHESLHGNLHPRPRVNEALGRLLHVGFGLSFHLIRYGHLSHHRFNRFLLDRPEVYEPAPGAWAWRALSYYPRLLGGLYFLEVLGGCAALLPRHLVERTVRGWPQKGDPDMPRFQEGLLRLPYGRERRAVALDALLGTGLLGVSAALYGPYWPLLAAYLGARALAISLTDNVWHYGTSLASGRYALSLRLPAPLSAGLLHFNYHRTHHAQPHLPWPRLPAAADQAGHPFAGALAPALLRQFRGPLPASALEPLPPDAQ